jgi:IclR family transcriptional regulator, acetate operon repressor
LLAAEWARRSALAEIGQWSAERLASLGTAGQNGSMSLDDALTSRKTGTQAIERAISILQLFAKVDGPLTLTEVSKASGLKIATTHRILGSLVRTRLLANDATSERYHIGPDALFLFAAAARRYGISAARSELDALTAATHETSAIGVVDGSDTVIVLQVESDLPLRFSRPIGTRVPVHVSAIGKAILAASSSDLQQCVDTIGALHRFTEHTITDRGRLLAELEETAERGWAVNDNERYRGVRAVAMPIRGDGEPVRAAVGVQGPADRIPDEQVPEIVVALSTSAQRLALHLRLTF